MKKTAKTAMKSKKRKSTKKVSMARKPKPLDIIAVLKEDHEPLKKLILVMKDLEASLGERRAAFKEFVPLLTVHARSEEKILYTVLKQQVDMAEEGFEGDVEHGLADQMAEEASRTEDKDHWSARVKVLAELVEHHIKEEESQMFPAFKNCSEAEQRKMMAEQYLQEKNKVMIAEQQTRKDSTDESKENKALRDSA